MNWRKSWYGVSVILASLAGSFVVSADAAASARNCGASHLSTITGYVSAKGISCPAAREVFVAVERAPLPNNVATTPYFRFSPSYSVPTPAGRFSCRREPHGLAGSEHTILCARRQMRIRWYTVHD